MASNERIRVLLADDHAVLRAGLRMLLDAQPDMAVVGEAETAEQAVAMDAHLKPDVVLMDLSLPSLPGNPVTAPAGLEAIRRIKAGRPEARVLALTMHDDEGYLRAVLEAGGAGYVLKRAADTELLSAIRAVWAVPRPATGGRAPDEGRRRLATRHGWPRGARYRRRA